MRCKITTSLQPPKGVFQLTLTIQRYTISIEDVYITVAGTIGKVGIVPEKFDGANLTENADKLIFTNYNKDCLVLTLNSKIVQDQIAEATTVVGQPKLAIARIEKLLIPVIPIQEQERITKCYSFIDKLISIYKEYQEELDEIGEALLENIKKSVLQYAIQGKLVPQLGIDGSANELLESIKAEKRELVAEGKIKKSALVDSIIFRGDDNKYYERIGNEVVDINNDIPFDIPDNWCWVRFKNLCRFNLGRTPERVNSANWKPGEVPWVAIADMIDKTILTETKEMISQKALEEKFSGVLSPKGTLIMSFKLTIGKVSILGMDAVHNEAIISIFPYVDKDNTVRDYLYNFLSIITGYTASTDAIKGATLNASKISEMLVPLPPIAEQKRIIAGLNRVLASIMRD